MRHPGIKWFAYRPVESLGGQTTTIIKINDNSNKAQIYLMSDSSSFSDELLDCLILLAKLEGIVTSRHAVTSGLPLEGGALTPDHFIRAANRAGVAALLVQRDLRKLSPNVLPTILLLEEGKACVLTGLDHELGLAFIEHPDSDEQFQVSLDELELVYTGQLFLTRRMQQFDDRSPKIFKEQGDHWFWGVIKNSRQIYRDVLIASFLVNLFVLAQPLFVMNIYDRVVPNSAFETLWALAIGIFIVYLFEFSLKSLRSYFLELAARRADIILSSQLFEKVLGIRQAHRPASIGAFANRLHEFDSIRNFVTSSTLLTLIDLPFVILFISVIAWLGGWLALIPLLLIPVAAAISWRAHNKVRPAVENVMRASSKKNATLVESLVGVETIKSLGAEGKVQKDWEQSVGYLAQWGLQARKISASAQHAVQFLQQISMVMVVVAGVYLIAEQNLTLGALIACVLLNTRALAPLGQVAGIMTQYQYAEATLSSLDEIMALPVERASDKRFMHHPVFRGDIQFKEVSFAYGEGLKPSLEQMSLTIKAGERVGIIGRIGSGKTTIARMVMRLFDAQKGAVLLDGFDIQQLDPADIRKNIGYLSQDTTLFYGTLRENIAIGNPGVSDAAIVTAVEKAGLAEFVNTHPLGIEMMVGERGDSLSGGQRQAVGLARLFLREPQVYLLDEPTSAMDNASEEKISRSIAEQIENSTLVLITHKASMLKLVDRLIVMDRGSVVADGPKEEVLASLKNGTVRGRG